MRIDSMFLERFLGELPSRQKEVEQAYSKIHGSFKIYSAVILYAGSYIKHFFIRFFAFIKF